VAGLGPEVEGDAEPARLEGRLRALALRQQHPQGTADDNSSTSSATPPDSPLEPIVPDHPHNPFHDPILQLALLQSPLSLGLRTPSSQSAYNTPQLSAASTPRPLPATLLLPFPEHHTMQHLGEQSIAGRAFQYAKFGGGDATAARQHAMHLQHYVAGVRAVEGSVIKPIIDAVSTTLVVGKDPAAWHSELWSGGEQLDADERSAQLPPGQQLYLLDCLADLYSVVAVGITDDSTEAYQTKLGRLAQMLGRSDYELGERWLLTELVSAHQRYLLAEAPMAAGATEAATAAATAAARKAARRQDYTLPLYSTLAGREQFLPPTAAVAQTTLAAINTAITTNRARITPRWTATRDLFLGDAARASRQSTKLAFISPSTYLLEMFKAQFGAPGSAERQQLVNCWPELSEGILDWVPRFRAAVSLNRKSADFPQPQLISLLLGFLEKTPHFGSWSSVADSIHFELAEPKSLEGVLIPLCERVRLKEIQADNLELLRPSRRRPAPRPESPALARPNPRVGQTLHPRSSASPSPGRRSSTPTPPTVKHVSWDALTASPAPGRATSPAPGRASSPTTYVNPREPCDCCRVPHPEGFCPARSAGSRHLPADWAPTTLPQFHTFSRNVVAKGLLDFRPMAVPLHSAPSAPYNHPLSPSSSHPPRPAATARPRDGRPIQTVPTTSGRRQQPTPSTTTNYNAFPPPQSYNTTFSPHRDDPTPYYEDVEPGIFGAHPTEFGAASTPPRRSPRTQSPAPTPIPQPAAAVPPPPPTPVTQPAPPPPPTRAFTVPDRAAPVPYGVTPVPAGVTAATLRPSSPAAAGAGRAGARGAPLQAVATAPQAPAALQLAQGISYARDSRPSAWQPDQLGADFPLADVLARVAREGEGSRLAQYLPAALVVISGIGTEQYATSLSSGHVAVHLPLWVMAGLPAPGGDGSRAGTAPGGDGSRAGTAPGGDGSRAGTAPRGGGSRAGTAAEGAEGASAMPAEMGEGGRGSPSSSDGSYYYCEETERLVRGDDRVRWEGGEGSEGATGAEAGPPQDWQAQAEEFLDRLLEPSPVPWEGGGPLEGRELRAEPYQDPEIYSNGGAAARQEAMAWEANRHAEAAAAAAEAAAWALQQAALRAEIRPRLEAARLRALGAAEPPASQDPWDLFSDEAPPSLPSSPPPSPPAAMFTTPVSNSTKPAATCIASSPLSKRVFKAPSISMLHADKPAVGISIFVREQLLPDSRPPTLCDSGANVNLMPLWMAQRLGLEWSSDGQVALYSTAPGPRPTLGKVTTPIKVRLAHGTSNAVTFDIPLHIIDTKSQSWGLLLGTGWLASVGACLDFFTSQLHYRPRLHEVTADKPLTAKDRRNLRVFSVP
jgi:hypothetical protein